MVCCSYIILLKLPANGININVGKHASNNYTAKNGEWLDGKRADVLLIPTTVTSESLPPILIEIQNVVDKPYMHRLSKYCNNIYDENNNIEPIALTICIKNVGPDSMYEADEINCSQLGNGHSNEAKGRLFYCKMTIIFNI